MSRSIALICYLAAATITVVAVYLLTTGGGDQKRPVGSGSELVGGGLLTANRDRLAICVQDIDSGASESEAKARVEIALIEVQQNPLWEKAGFGQKDPRVKVGCPSPPLMLQPDVEVIDARMGSELEVWSKALVVAEASYYRVFFFVVPSETIARTFGSAQQYVTEEYLRLAIMRG